MTEKKGGDEPHQHGWSHRQVQETSKVQRRPQNVVPGSGHHALSFWRVQLTRPNMEGIEAVIVLAQDPSICKAPSRCSAGAKRESEAAATSYVGETCCYNTI